MNANWISVKDRMPEDFINVLISGIRDGEKITAICFRRNGSWIDTAEIPAGIDVSYWKSLTSPELDDSWISVKDKLPEISKTVLIFGQKKLTDCKLDRGEIIETAFFSIESKFFFMGMRRKYWVKNTHWMPLPEPPTGDD